MSACRNGSKPQRQTQCGIIRHRADATCMHRACEWQQLGQWGGSDEGTIAVVVRAARYHTAVTGHETMVDMVTRRHYLRRAKAAA